MDYGGIIFFLVGAFAFVCSYKEYEWFMNHRKARFLIKILGDRDRARKFYMGLGAVIMAVGLLAAFRVVNLDSTSKDNSAIVARKEPKSEIVVVKDDITDLVKDAVLTESIGIETLGGAFTPIIEKGRKIPVQKSVIFSTAVNNQPSVQVHILTGSSKTVKDNQTLGTYIVGGILPAPRGEPKIEITFGVSNDTVWIGAKDVVRQNDLVVVKDLEEDFKMVVEDVFSIGGREGPVVTGIIQSGIISKGDEVILQNANGETKVKVTFIEVFNKPDLPLAKKGDNVGLILLGITSSQVKRGDILRSQD